MTRRHKSRIAVEFTVSAVRSETDSIEPEHAEPTQVASRCVDAIIHAIWVASQAAVKGDRKPTIPDGMPVDLVLAPGIVLSCTYKDLVEAQKVFE